MSNAVSRLR
jgi:hypothetical protein